MEPKNNVGLIVLGVVVLSVATYAQASALLAGNQVVLLVAAMTGAFLGSLGVKSVTITNPTFVKVATALMGAVVVAQASPLILAHPWWSFGLGSLSAVAAGLNIQPPDTEQLKLQGGK